jgi:hypothetical protein
MHYITAHEVKGGDHTVDGLAQHGDIGRPLRENLMKTKQHVTLEHTRLL